MLTKEGGGLAEGIPLTGADDSRLLEISRKGLLSLSLQEMKTIQAHFKKLGRDPSDVELETLAQTWSEHCKHKTFSGIIEYQEEGRGSRVYDNLLKSTIMRVTEELDRPWCWSTFKDNAGVIAFDDEWGIAFKAETHNHPSALEPYGGSGTGLGGVIRDILGVGLGAKPVMNTDVFAFAPLDLPKNKIPKGHLAPRRIIKGVIAGVRDYGNRMGIPTANGAVYFDEGYIGNPLVFCGTVGLIPKNKVAKEVKPGDLVVVSGRPYRARRHPWRNVLLGGAGRGHHLERRADRARDHGKENNGRFAAGSRPGTVSCGDRLRCGWILFRGGRIGIGLRRARRSGKGAVEISGPYAVGNLGLRKPRAHGPRGATGAMAGASGLGRVRRGRSERDWDLHG